MGGKFTHYLITRYNVLIPGWTTDKKGLKTLDRDWMAHRLDIFRKFCVPTVANQVNSNFHWLIYCDKETNAEDLDSIQKAISNLPHAQIRLVSIFHDIIPDLHRIFTSISTPFIITSRVDNDDGLGPDYIKIIQDHFRPENKMIINILGGILYDVPRKILTRIDYSLKNHFLSIIEENKLGGAFITSMGFPHGQPPVDSHIVNVPIKYGWLKIIHERNKMSQTGGKPLYSSQIMKIYNLGNEFIPINYYQSFYYSIRRLASLTKKKMIKQFSSWNK